MVRINITVSAALLFAFWAGVPTLAQSSSSQASSAVISTQPSQSKLQSPPAQPNSTTVWTNEDLSGLRGDSVASNRAVAPPKPSATATKPSATAASRGKDAKWYHDQISKLQAQLPPLDAQISNYQAALAGKPVDSTRTYGWVRPADWSAQLAQLQQKRDDISNKITSLVDEARHKGIPANTLP